MSPFDDAKNREGTVHEWFVARRDQIGTHSETCWKHHPDCAYWAGRELAAVAIEAQITEDPPFTDPYNRALDHAADIARGNS